MLRIFNTMTQRVEPFESRAGQVGLYVCGVTPYDTAHLGHAFVFTTFDILVRYLRFQGLRVTYVENVTDIDDPLFEKALQLGNITFDALAKRETERFVKEMSAIHVGMPDHFIFASDELPQMFTLIQHLLDGGYAYNNDGWLYFSVASDPNFARLAAATGLTGYANLLRRANENGNDPNEPHKRDPLDFLLWRAAQPGEPEWASPWGPGRPGWHIECSAMATRYLGPQVDIHGGGADLIFPHHSCEIAQSEHATGVSPYVRYWMHIGLVAYEGTKMSKSLGNLVIVNQLLEHYTPNAIRLMLANHHYRQAWEFFLHDMEDDQALADLLAEAARGDLSATAPATGSATARFEADFIAALESDLDTPSAIQHLKYFAEMVRTAALGDETPVARARLRALAAILGVTFD